MTQTLLMLPEHKREKRVGRMRVKEKDKAVSASVIAWHYSILTQLQIT
jgi:hypothetical protein